MEFTKKSENIFYINFKSKNTQDKQIERSKKEILDKKMQVECNTSERFINSFNGSFVINPKEDIEDWELTGNKIFQFQWVSEAILTPKEKTFILKPMNHNRKIKKGDILKIKFGMSGNNLPSNLVLKYRTKN